MKMHTEPFSHDKLFSFYVFPVMSIYANALLFGFSSYFFAVFECGYIFLPSNYYANLMMLSQPN